MSLTRATVTVAQRVMTVVHVALAAALGYGYTFHADQLRVAPSYRGADEILPLELWGIGFVGIAILLAVALVAHRRNVYVIGLAWLTVWMIVWAGVFVATFFRGDSTFLAWVWPAYVAAGAWASMLSLLAQER